MSSATLQIVSVQEAIYELEKEIILAKAAREAAIQRHTALKRSSDECRARVAAKEAVLAELRSKLRTIVTTIASIDVKRSNEPAVHSGVAFALGVSGMRPDCDSSTLVSALTSDISKSGAALDRSLEEHRRARIAATHRSNALRRELAGYEECAERLQRHVLTLVNAL